MLTMTETQDLPDRKNKIRELSNEMFIITKLLSENIDNFVKNFKQFGRTFIFDQLVMISVNIIGLRKSD
jgi:hypothetical protein